MTDKNELKALSLKDQINASHRECLRAGNEAIHFAYETGGLLTDVKKLLKLVNGGPSLGDWQSQFLTFGQRTAQVYMKLHKDLRELPKAQRSALFDASKSIDSLAKQFANSKPKPKPAPAAAPSTPNRGGPEPVNDPTKPQSPGDYAEPAEDETDDTPAVASRPTTKKATQPPKQIERSGWFKQWDTAIGPLVRLVDKIADGVGEKGAKQKAVHKHLHAATAAMMEWMQVK